MQPDTEFKHRCGFILANGEFYGCYGYGHIYIANELFESGKLPSNRYEDYNVIHIGFTEIYPMKPFEITQAQLDTLFDFCVHYSRLEEFEAFKETWIDDSARHIWQ